MILLLRLFSRKWMLATILVLVGSAVLARLGIWQLDRLSQRRAFNARVMEQVNQPALMLSGSGLTAELEKMEYRQVEVVGEFDFSQEVILRNQVYQEKYGVYILTPLRIVDSNLAVMVNRGWIPIEEYQSGHSSSFTEPGIVHISGVIRLSQEKPDFGRISDPTPAPGEGRLEVWNLANIPRMAEQISYPLLPIYIQQSPDPGYTRLPYRTIPSLELTEGSHLSYAIQWFSFAGILFLGYPFYARKEELRADGRALNTS